MNKFRQLMDSVPYGKYELVKYQVINGCGITKAIFNNWNVGRTTLPTMAIPIIVKIAKKHNLVFEID